MSTQVRSFSHPGVTKPSGLHGSRLCGCCRLLSRQCRSCVAISSYIWLLGLWRLCWLPGRVLSAPLRLVAATLQRSDWLYCLGGGGGSPSCEPHRQDALCVTTPQGTPVKAFGVYILTPTPSRSPPPTTTILYLILWFCRCLALSEVPFVWNVLGRSKWSANPIVPWKKFPRSDSSPPPLWQKVLIEPSWMGFLDDEMNLCFVLNLAYNVDFCVVQSTATLSAGFLASYISIR